ncbi:CGI-121-domain-containing protein [Panus rudis PR-1116 ss-1]|nr:CGI-121-domain-containing protein [Panus rudis PR-1116 ss-1]
MESFYYPQHPPESSYVHVALFTNVTNASELRDRLVKAASMAGPEGVAEREAVDFAFIDATLVCSTLHLQTAIVSSILAQSQGVLRTKTVHSEILWNLNPTNNISEAIRRYGIAANASNVLVVKVSSRSDSSAVLQGINDVLSGQVTPLSHLQSISDWPKIRKYHKIGAKLDKDPGKDLERAHEIVVGSVATKGVTL